MVPKFCYTVRMSRKSHMGLKVAATLAAAAAILGGALWLARYRHAAVRTAERKSMLDRFGLVGDGTQDFVALPHSLTHRAPAARLGERLFTDRRLARNQYRVCGACHRLNAGGIDARALGGVLGMFAFRHKTKHWYFRLFFPLMLALQIGILIAVYVLFVK